MKRYESYKSAARRLDAELDINRVLNAVRLTEFMAMLNLKRYQRLLVSHFRRYQIEEVKPKKDLQKLVDPTQFVQRATTDLDEGTIRPTDRESLVPDFD